MLIRREIYNVFKDLEFLASVPNHDRGRRSSNRKEQPKSTSVIQLVSGGPIVLPRQLSRLRAHWEFRPVGPLNLARGADR